VAYIAVCNSVAQQKQLNIHVWSQNLRHSADHLLAALIVAITDAVTGNVDVKINPTLIRHASDDVSVKRRKRHSVNSCCMRVARCEATSRVSGTDDVSVCVSDFFELNCALHLRLEATPTNCTNDVLYSSVRASYFAVRVINVRNSLSADRVDFSFTPFLFCYCD